MITSTDYKVEIYKILGLALLSPFGKLVISIPDLGWKLFKPSFFIAFVLFSLFALIGIILILYGYEIIKGKN